MWSSDVAANSRPAPGRASTLSGILRWRLLDSPSTIFLVQRCLKLLIVLSAACADVPTINNHRQHDTCTDPSKLHLLSLQR
jgi:hypothetical protein